MNDIASLIGTLGFPIVCAVILAFVVKYMFDKYTTDLKEMSKLHKEENDKFADALNKNTLVLGKVATILNNISQKIDEKGGDDDGK